MRAVSLCAAVAAMVWLCGGASAAAAAAALPLPALRMPLRRETVSLHHTDRDSRHPSRALKAPVEEVPIYGRFRDLAYFYADVFVGTPPQKFTVIADTGSTLLAFPCKGCSSCGAHLNPKFDVSKSSTVQSVPCAGNHCTTCSHNHCGYHQSYAEGSSLAGVYYKDLVWLGGASSSVAEGHQYGVDFQFGCHSSETKLFKTQRADGIMGLSQSTGSLMTTLFDSSKVARHMFTMCLSLDGPGTFALGGMDTSLHSAPIQWASLTATRSFYTVTVKSAHFDYGTSLANKRFNSGGHTIVDSGTSFTYVPAETFNQLKSSVLTYCAQAGKCKGSAMTVQYESLCYRLAHTSDLATFPSMSIELEGADHNSVVSVRLPPNKLFINMAWDQGAYCLGVYSNGNGGGVIGANAMLDYDVAFDVTGRKVGFAPSNCVFQDTHAAAPSTTPAPSTTAAPSLTATATMSATPLPSPHVDHHQHAPSPEPSPQPEPYMPGDLDDDSYASARLEPVNDASKHPTADGGTSSEFLVGLISGLAAFVAAVVGAVCFVAFTRREVRLGSLNLSRRTGQQRFTELTASASAGAVGYSDDASATGGGDDDDDDDGDATSAYESMTDVLPVTGAYHDDSDLDAGADLEIASDVAARQPVV